MGGILSFGFLELVDHLNAGTDDFTNSFINKTFHNLTTLSAVHPSLQRNKPLLCIRDLLLLVFNFFMLFVCLSLGYISACTLLKINYALFMHEVHIMMWFQMSLTVLWHSWSKRSNTAILHKIIAQNFFDYQEDLSATWKSLRDDMKKDRRRCVQSIVLIGFATAIAALLTPVLNQIASLHSVDKTSVINHGLPFLLAYPFQMKDSYVFFFVYAMELLGSSILCLILSTKCFIFIDDSLYIQMHLKLLVFQFENIETRAEKLYRKLYGTQVANLGLSESYSDNTFSQCYKICLLKNIRHHQIIIRAVRELSSVFGFYTFSFYLTCTAAIAMSIISTSSTAEFPGITVAAIIMSSVEIFFVGLYAHLGQKITDLAKDLRQVIYSTQWYGFDRDLTKIMKIVQAVTSEPLTISYYNIVCINYDSFAKVLNSAYSYYSLVNAYK